MEGRAQWGAWVARSGVVKVGVGGAVRACSGSGLYQAGENGCLSGDMGQVNGPSPREGSEKQRHGNLLLYLTLGG